MVTETVGELRELLERRDYSEPLPGFEALDDIYAAAGDILLAVNSVDNNHVEVIDRLDRTNELLERIAFAMEAFNERRTE